MSSFKLIEYNHQIRMSFQSRNQIKSVKKNNILLVVVEFESLEDNLCMYDVCIVYI